MGGSSSKSPAMTAAAREYVDSLITSKKVVVFSKTYCPYCCKAKEALWSLPIKDECLEWVEINKRSDCDAIQVYMQELTGARSVPRVFIGGKFFGGGDDTCSAKANGKLLELLKCVGAV